MSGAYTRSFQKQSVREIDSNALNWSQLYGCPNKPPENWDTPDKPAVRSVTGADDSGGKMWADLSVPVDEHTCIVVRLVNVDWTDLLKMLDLYGQEHGGTQTRFWLSSIKRAVLRLVRTNTDEAQPVAV